MKYLDIDNAAGLLNVIWADDRTITFTIGQKKRTITHLQSLSYPAAHYYFDRRLSNQQAVALASGQRNAETIPGFTGRISQTEMLFPAWVGTKRALLLAQLHWNAEG